MDEFCRLRRNEEYGACPDEVHKCALSIITLRDADSFAVKVFRTTGSHRQKPVMELHLKSMQDYGRVRPWDSGFFELHTCCSVSPSLQLCFMIWLVGSLFGYSRITR